MPKEKSAGAIIFREQEGKRYYLLLHYPGINRKGGHWEFVKGHIEDNEPEEETIKREAEEETGIRDLKIIPGFKKYIKYFFRASYGLKGKARKKAPWVFKLVIFCLAETKTREIKLSPEHDSFLWLPYEQALKKITYKNSKELLKKAHKFLSFSLKKTLHTIVRGV